MSSLSSRDKRLHVREKQLVGAEGKKANYSTVYIRDYTIIIHKHLTVAASVAEKPDRNKCNKQVPLHTRTTLTVWLCATARACINLMNFIEGCKVIPTQSSKNPRQNCVTQTGLRRNRVRVQESSLLRKLVSYDYITCRAEARDFSYGSYLQ